MVHSHLNRQRLVKEMEWLGLKPKIQVETGFEILGCRLATNRLHIGSLAAART
jgi:hypothetical protein